MLATLSAGQAPATPEGPDRYPEPSWRRPPPIRRTPASRCTRSSRSGRRGTRCGRRSTGRRRGRRATLRWTDDVHATWADPNCVVGQACGWPVAALLRDTVDVVGAFTLTVPGHAGTDTAACSSAATGRALAELVDAGAVAVANSADSLSGWISFLAAVDASGAGAPVARRGDLVRGPHREPASPAGGPRRRGVHRRGEPGAHQAPLSRSRGRPARDRQRATGAEPSRHRPGGDAGALVDSLRDAFTWARGGPRPWRMRAPRSASTASSRSINAEYATTLLLVDI